jgi:hypothetical protein
VSYFLCRCGNSIDTTRHPSPNVSWLMAEPSLEKEITETACRIFDLGSLEQAISENKYSSELSAAEILYDILISAIAESSQKVVKCGDCGRLYADNPGRPEGFECWVPEN